jgi:hypothetical protein
MSNQVQLTESFKLPGYRAGLEVLLFLSRSLRKTFSEQGVIETFERSRNSSWLKVVNVFGALKVDPEFTAYETGQISDLWDAFFRLNTIKQLEPQLQVILKEARDKCLAAVNAKEDCLSELQLANKDGYAIVKSILIENGLETLMPPNPLPIEVFYDSAGQEYCAGSSRWTNIIRWGYQPVAHSLAGAIIGELLFAHEYLSHLVPKNDFLDQTIREQWLVAALRGAILEDSSRAYWKNKLWPLYRSKLLSHVEGVARKLAPDASSVSFSGCEGAEDVLSYFYIKDRESFWRLTSEILRQEPDQETARNATEVACTLSNRGPSVLGGNKLFKLNDLIEEF